MRRVALTLGFAAIAVLACAQSSAAPAPDSMFVGTWKSTLKGQLLSQLQLNNDSGKLAGTLTYPDEWDDDNGVITSIGTVFNGVFDQEKLLKSLVLGNTVHLVMKQYGDTDVVEADFTVTGKDTGELKFTAPRWIAYLKPWKYTRESTGSESSTSGPKIEQFAGVWQASWHELALYELNLSMKGGKLQGTFAYPDVFRANAQGDVIMVFDYGLDESRLIEAKPFGRSLILKFIDDYDNVTEMEMVMNSANLAEVRFVIPPQAKEKLSPATLSRQPG